MNTKSFKSDKTKQEINAGIFFKKLGDPKST